MTTGMRWSAGLFALGGVGLTATVGAQVYLSSDADFARDGWAILLPWVAVALLGAASFLVPRAPAVLLLSIAGAISVRFAGPIAGRPLVWGLPEVLWGTQGVPREPWAEAIIEGADRRIQQLSMLQLAAAVPLGIAVIALVLALWSKGQRRWDAVLLVAAVAFSAICLVVAPYGLTGEISLGNLNLYATSPGVIVLCLTWVVPVALWAVLQVGRSGFESVAAAVGLVVAMVVVPVTVDLVARLLGGYTSFFAHPGDSLPDYDAAASEVLDRLGFWWFAPTASVALLLVAGLRFLMQRPTHREPVDQPSV